MIEHMTVGVGFEVAHKASVVLEVLVEQFLSREQGVGGVHDYAHVAVPDVGLRVAVQRRVLASDRGRDLADHPAHRLR